MSSIDLVGFNRNLKKDGKAVVEEECEIIRHY